MTFSGRKGHYDWTTLYGHNYKNYVQVGEYVIQGHKIAKMGASESHRATRPF